MTPASPAQKPADPAEAPEVAAPEVETSLASAGAKGERPGLRPVAGTQDGAPRPAAARDEAKTEARWPDWEAPARPAAPPPRARTGLDRRPRIDQALRKLTAGARGGLPRLGQWTDAPAPGLALAWLLPPAAPGHPPVAFGLGDAPPRDPVALSDLSAGIDAARLWWPATLAGAQSAEALVDLRGAPRTRATRLLDLLAETAPRARAVALVQSETGEALARDRGLATAWRLAEIDPDGIDLVVADHGALAHRAALAGRRGLTPFGEADPWPWLARARFVDPWRRGPIATDEALEALSFLREAAQRNDRPVVTVGFSRWKRRNAEAFLTGPSGPPVHMSDLEEATRLAGAAGARLAVWGTRETPQAERENVQVLRLEDGFLRSVGLGLRHAPPASLAVDRGGLYFDATRASDFETLTREAVFDAALTARAAALRRRLTELGITKYNLAHSAPLPATERQRILVPGQVEGDQSLRFGSPEMQSNTALLRAVRERHPEAFILYKPHPDVLTGMRPGAVDPATLADCADAVAADSAAEACLQWADRVETMTSLMGFEALMRDKPVTAFGRPFYAGWGLTESPFDPTFSRGRRLTRDELAAAALILYPRYVDPRTRLPAPAEKVLEWLHAERDYVRTKRGRVRELWRGLASRALNIGR